MSLDNIRKDLRLLRHLVFKKTTLNSHDFGPCPFHSEKTSSFHIYNGIDRARYHCFGCGATGDIFNYLHKTEKLSFELAVMKLKSIIKNGAYVLPLPPEDQSPVEESQNQDILPITQQNLNCISKCWSYLELEQDYRELWEENQKFRVWLNLGPFIPSNEKKAPGTISSQGEKISCRKGICTLTPKCKYDCFEFTLDF